MHLASVAHTAVAPEEMVDDEEPARTVPIMPSTWIDTTDVPAPAPERELVLARSQARSYLQCQILTCLTSADGLTLPASAFRWPTKNEERTVLFLRRLWDLGYDLSWGPQARRRLRHLVAHRLS